MAIAFVNSAGLRDNGPQAVTIAAPALNCAAGNTIIVGISNYTPGNRRTVVSIADTAGNTYTRCGVNTEGGNGSHDQEVWVATNIIGHASNVVTVTFSGAATYRVVGVAQYSGLAASNVYDSASVGVISEEASTAKSTGAATSTADGDLCFGWFVGWNYIQGTVLSASPPNVIRLEGVAPDYVIADRIAGSAGDYSVTINATSGSSYYAQMRTFKAAGGGTTYTEALTATVASVASIDDRQTYVEAASVLIQSGVSVADVQTMLESVIAVAASTATATDVAQMVEQCLTTVQSASSVSDAVAYVETLLISIQGTGTAADIQQAVETVQTDIQSAATVADVAQLVESLLITIQGTGTVTDTLVAGTTYAETLLVTATSAAEAQAAQSYVEGVTAVAQGIGSATELQTYLEALTATGEAIATVTDRQLYYDNVAIMAISGASVTEIGTYIEQVQTAATGTGSVVDVIQGAFVGGYVFRETARPRTYTEAARPRTYRETARRRPC